MQVHIPAKDIPSEPVKLDRTKPLVKFDPWPFAEYNIPMVRTYLYSTGRLLGPSGYALEPEWNALGTATDGRPVIIGSDAYDNLVEGKA